MKLTNPALPATAPAARAARALAGSRFARGAALLLAILAVTSAPAVLAAPMTPSSRADAAVGADQDTGATISVMTRNMDLGSDYAPALTATSLADLEHGATTIYNEIAASDPAGRAAGIAAEIQAAMPTVVSLQEVSLIQRFVPTPNGLTLLDQIDQLGALQAALAKLGLDYKVVAVNPEFDVTAPSDVGYYVRVLDREAILVRTDLPAQVLSVAGTQTGHFANLLTLASPAGPIVATRGWASVDLATATGTVRVVDTHLEALSGACAAKQAHELVADSGPANTALPVIVAGDLNSGPGTTIDAYDVIAGALTDTWPVTKPNNPGLTWALHGEDFNPYQTMPDRRIDVVFERGLRPITDVLVGTSDLTSSGLYPSDHAGVVARLAIGP